MQAHSKQYQADEMIKWIQFEKDIQSKYRRLFLKVRALLLSYDGMIETKKDRITTYSFESSGVCHMRTTKDGVDIGYLKGAQIKDKFHVLTGKTKKMRVHKILANAPFNEAEIRYYIEEGLALNRER